MTQPKKAPVSHRDTCRLCGSKRVEKVVGLKPIPLSENYTQDAESAKKAPRFPVDVYMCSDCGHVQHLDVIDPAVLWDSYTYFSGEAKGMPEHFRAVSGRMLEAAKPPEGALVIDIGSNDGSLLKPFRDKGFRVLGIDPATEVARRANADGISTFAELMSRPLAANIRAEQGPAHIISAFNVFAHADDLAEMVDCVKTMLAPDGLFFFEAQYLLDIIDGVLIATIFHEHMSHHSVKPLASFLDRHGLELIAVDRAKIQHGSIIGTVQHKGAGRPVQASVYEILALEDARKLNLIETLHAFGRTVNELRQTTAKLVERWKREGATVAAYGAARSGPTLIAQLGLDGVISYIVDDHPQKVGKYSSGDGIPILPTRMLSEKMPDYCVILAWVHSEKIIETSREYLEKGGRLVVLCPRTRVVGKDGDLSL
jgi:SAM-dependent methyltransferase